MSKLGDAFGDRMKSLERVETSTRFDPTLPLYARIDGRGFSKFTKGMDRPYDARMSNAMIDATKILVEKTGALIGYVQSDEISLLWEVADVTQLLFDGKKQKMVSVLAGLATAAFTQAMFTNNLEGYFSRMPHFDARVFSLPTRTEATNAILWRVQDATKNAISMAAYSMFSHNSLQKKNSADKVALMKEAGVDFNDYPGFFREGTFVRRIVEQRVMTEVERLCIPEANRPEPNMMLTRSRVAIADLPNFRGMANRDEVLFEQATPVMREA
jgi:tRNA(His) guanylyltransferase